MNAALIALVGLGVVGMAVAASASPASSAPSSGAPSLVNDAAAMVRIFDTYSVKQTDLTWGQLTELAKLNAAAKGIPYKTVPEFAKEYYPDKPERIWYDYRATYFLPPGVPTAIVLGGPDFFSGWAGELPTPVFVRWEFKNGVGYEYGHYIDWFGRRVGEYLTEQAIYGRSDLLDIFKGFYRDFADIGPAVAKAVADIASNYPGIGTAIAGAVTFLSEVGSGASLENAALAAGKAAVPSTLRSAYDLGVGLATQGELDVEAAMQVAMALAISQGVVTGDILERYETIKQSYEDAKELGAGLEGLGTVVEVAV